MQVVAVPGDGFSVYAMARELLQGQQWSLVPVEELEGVAARIGADGFQVCYGDSGSSDGGSSESDSRHEGLDVVTVEREDGVWCVQLCVLRLVVETETLEILAVRQNDTVHFTPSMRARRAGLLFAERACFRLFKETDGAMGQHVDVSVCTSVELQGFPHEYQYTLPAAFGDMAARLHAMLRAPGARASMLPWVRAQARVLGLMLEQEWPKVVQELAARQRGSGAPGRMEAGLLQLLEALEAGVACMQQRLVACTEAERAHAAVSQLRGWCGQHPVTQEEEWKN